MVLPCDGIIQFSIDCEWSNVQTMIVELLLSFVIGVGVAWKFRSKIAEDVVKKIQKKEQTRDTQIVKDLLDSFNSLKNTMEGLQSWAKTEVLMNKQQKEIIEKKHASRGRPKIIRTRGRQKA